jgi:GTP-binding protein
MLPVISLVGRPNVGKSTLFNRLTRSRDALVDDQPGVTRDRLYGKGKIGPVPFLVVDTGGLESDDEIFSSQIRSQVELVIAESDIIFFLVDASQGIVANDIEIANLLRRRESNVVLLVNKSEGINAALATPEFQELAMGAPVAVSAKRGDGISAMLENLLGNRESVPESLEYSEQEPGIAIVGRPNVGKSTLANKLVGEYRVIVSDVPGTTRDSVRIPLSYRGENYALIDTAGVRKKARVTETIEKFSVVKTLQAIETCHVVILVLDASTGLAAQDSTIAGMVNDLGRSIVVILNKWDGLDPRHRKAVRREVEKKFEFLPGPEILTVSALHGSSVGDVLPAVMRAFKSAMIDIATSSLNRTLQDALVQTPPPMHNQRPIRLKFAHQAGKNPPVIVIHGNQANNLPESYRRYLSRYFSKAYRLVGTPIRILTRVSENPFKKRNPSATRVYKKRSGRRRKL